MAKLKPKGIDSLAILKIFENYTDKCVAVMQKEYKVSAKMHHTSVTNQKLKWIKGREPPVFIKVYVFNVATFKKYWK